MGGGGGFFGGIERHSSISVSDRIQINKLNKSIAAEPLYVNTKFEGYYLKMWWRLKPDGVKPDLVTSHSDCARHQNAFSHSEMVQDKVLKIKVNRSRPVNFYFQHFVRKLRQFEFYVISINPLGSLSHRTLHIFTRQCRNCVNLCQNIHVHDISILSAF